MTRARPERSRRVLPVAAAAMVGTLPGRSQGLVLVHVLIALGSVVVAALV